MGTCCSNTAEEPNKRKDTPATKKRTATFSNLAASPPPDKVAAKPSAIPISSQGSKQRHIGGTAGHELLKPKARRYLPEATASELTSQQAPACPQQSPTPAEGVCIEVSATTRSSNQNLAATSNSGDGQVSLHSDASPLSAPADCTTDDLEAKRRAKEVLRKSNDVAEPKIVEFELIVDDDELPMPDDGGEDAIEAFNSTFDDQEQALGGVEKPPALQTEEDEKVCAAWFATRGVVPPNVTWYQSKRQMFLSIVPAPVGCGYGIDELHRLIEFNAEGDEGRKYRVILPLLQPVFNPKFDLKSIQGVSRSVLYFSADKFKDDDDDSDRSRYWTQLIRATRKDYFELNWISRDMDVASSDEEDEGYMTHPTADGEVRQEAPPPIADRNEGVASIKLSNNKPIRRIYPEHQEAMNKNTEPPSVFHVETVDDSKVFSDPDT